jgi:isoprenylcysteine carboxyl methyltransferase (ICMT) family protein YpbQ
MNDKKAPKKAETSKQDGSFVFGKENYQLMILGFVVIIVGFMLMYGTTDIFDFRKLTLAPIVVLAGFVIEIFAIMRKPKD